MSSKQFAGEESLVVLLENLRAQARAQLTESSWKSWHKTATRYSSLLSLTVGALREHMSTRRQTVRQVLDAQYLLLPYSEDTGHVVCGLGVGHAHCDIGFYLLLIDANDGQGKATATLMRFESPHGAGEGADSIHGYFHAQMTFYGGSDPETTVYAMTNIPAVPVPARCRVTLLLSLLKSVYGRNYLSIIADQQLRPHVDYVELRVAA